MFTGIIEDIGILAGINKMAGRWEFVVKTNLDPAGIGIGDSISVNGVCLTVTGKTGNSFSVDASLETLRVTALEEAAAGMRVNIERAMAADGRFGGHLVMGHVDCIGVVSETRNEGDSIRIVVEVPADFVKYIVEKGSIAIDGVSLTVNGQRDNMFWVNIIPHTVAQTTIAQKKVRDKVNIETDIIGKYIESFIKRQEKKGIDLDFLARHGFVKGE